MKNLILLLLCLTVGYNTQAQVPAASIEQLMKNRMYSCYEVEYNAIVVVPELYKNNKTDTLNALISFWKCHCELNERLFTLNTLNTIRNKTFKESLSQNDFLSPRLKPSLTEVDIYKSNILPYLKEYKEACHGAFSDVQYKEWLKGDYALPKDYTDYYNFYKQYYAFLRAMAASLQGKRAYTPIENFMLRFYANPDSVRLAELDSAIYDGTTLQHQYKSLEKYNNNIHGWSRGVETGIWVPHGPLSVLGAHPYGGFRLGGRTNNLIIDFTVGFRFSDAPNNFKVRDNDSTYNSQRYFSYYTNIEFGYKLYRTKKSEWDVLWGIGSEGIQILLISGPTVDTATDIVRKTITSINLYAGLAYRVYVRDKIIDNKHRYSYFSLQAKYCYNNYDNSGGTNLSGNAINIALVYGGFSHSYTKYPNML